MIKNNFIVVTGGPGSGKSTLLKCLEEKGFSLVRETGREIIKQRLSKRLSPRPEPAEFAKLMFQMDYDNYFGNRHSKEPLFFDRSFLDSACLLHQTNKTYFDEIKDVIEKHRFNPNVFIAPPWEEIFCNDDERDQSLAEAITVHNDLHDWYQVNGYHLIQLPKVAPDLRVEFVLEKIAF